MSARHVFVRGEGVAKELERAAGAVSVQLASSFRRLTVPRERVRELISRDAAQRLLAELQSPLTEAVAQTSAQVATAQLTERDDPSDFARLLRGFYVKPVQADEDLLPRLTLESFLSHELSAVVCHGPRTARDVARVGREHLASCEDVSLRSARRQAAVVKGKRWSFWWD